MKSIYRHSYFYTFQFSYRMVHYYYYKYIQTHLKKKLICINREVKILKVKHNYKK